MGFLSVEGRKFKFGKGPKGDNGATFIPSVSPEGLLTWTNDKDLDNPSPISIKGPEGTTGADGATFIPSVSSAGVLSWTNNGGLSNPPDVNIKGPAGENSLDVWSTEERVVGTWFGGRSIYEKSFTIFGNSAGNPTKPNQDIDMRNIFEITGYLVVYNKNPSSSSAKVLYLMPLISNISVGSVNSLYYTTISLNEKSRTTINSQEAMTYGNSYITFSPVFNSDNTELTSSIKLDVVNLTTTKVLYFKIKYLK